MMTAPSSQTYATTEDMVVELESASSCWCVALISAWHSSLAYRSYFSSSSPSPLLPSMTLSEAAVESRVEEVLVEVDVVAAAVPLNVASPLDPSGILQRLGRRLASLHEEPDPYPHSHCSRITEVSNVTPYEES